MFRGEVARAECSGAGGELALNSQSGHRRSAAELVDVRASSRPWSFPNTPEAYVKCAKLGVSTDGH